MATFKVNVDKLNLRSSPVQDFANKANVVGVLRKDSVFTCVRVIENELGRWCVGADGHCVSEKWLGEITFTSEISTKKTPWWIEQLKIEEIWNSYSEKGARAKVAVLDSGINQKITDVKNGVFKEFVHPAFPSSVTIDDTNGHGTYCASLIGGRNKNFIVGCAPECDLYIAKITEEDTFEINILYDSIEWAIKENVDIISISQGGPFDKNTCDLISLAFEKNIIVIASIGNNPIDNEISTGGKYPALCEKCIAVGATTIDKQLSRITLRNPKTEINAPGESIFGYIKESNPEIFPDGTSQATAIVAGICTLVISRHKALNKSYTAASIKNLITSNFDVIVNSTQKLISPQKIFEKI